MKIKSTIAIFTILFAIAFQQVSAQDSKPQVKILPAKENGFIKIMYLGDNTSDVQVKFYNDKGLYTVDVVERSTFKKGFLKKYDIKKVRPGENFWVDVSGATVAASFIMTPSKDEGGYVATLQRMELSPVIIASKD